MVVAPQRDCSSKTAGLLARAFLPAFPVHPVADGQAHVPYSRGGGTGFSPASRFTAFPSGSTVS